MRTVVVVAILATILVSAGADAKSARRKTINSIDVRPRSFLDAGNTVPVGSKSNYVYDSTGTYATSFHGNITHGEPLVRIPRDAGVPIDFGAAFGTLR